MAETAPAPTKTIRVSLLVYEALRELASTWEDTPDRVLRRLLKLEENGG